MSDPDINPDWLPDSEVTDTYRQNLLTWFDTNQRELPWRGSTDPYSVWVSEIMLQQTQVATVIDYYHRWMALFPTVEDLAQAELDDVLSIWAGLGYYRRAKLLHRAAQELADQPFPASRDTLLEVPGIGRYTAGAVASICFDEAVGVVDGNVKRVLARQFAIDSPPGSRAAEKRYWQLAEHLVPEDQPGAFNQATMELGAMVCRPRNPTCMLCPIRWNCQAFALDQVQAFPPPKPKKSPRVQTTHSLVVQDGDRLLMVRDSQDGLLSGLWGFPGFDSSKALAEAIAPLKGVSLGSVKHIFSHIHMTYEVVLLRQIVDLEVGELDSKWIAQTDLEGLAMSTAMKKVASLLAN